MASIVNVITVVFGYLFMDPADLHVTVRGKKYTLYPLWVLGVLATMLALTSISCNM